MRYVEYDENGKITRITSYEPESGNYVNTTDDNVYFTTHYVNTSIPEVESKTKLDINADKTAIIADGVDKATVTVATAEPSLTFVIEGQAQEVTASAGICTVEVITAQPSVTLLMVMSLKYYSDEIRIDAMSTTLP
jgi:hypothetical protein